jgi:hypothetical protein
MDFLLALAASSVGVAMLYMSWRRSQGWKRLTVPVGWLLVCLSGVLWIRFGGAEFGMAYTTMAVAFGAWGVVVALGRESRRPGERRRQPRVAREAPARAAIVRTLARAFVALPLAGTASLLASVLMIADLPGVIANRYVFAILMAPVIWGVLAIWVGMTTKLSRTALLLAGVSAALSALLFIR